MYLASRIGRLSFCHSGKYADKLFLGTPIKRLNIYPLNAASCANLNELSPHLIGNRSMEFAQTFRAVAGQYDL